MAHQRTKERATARAEGSTRAVATTFGTNIVIALVGLATGVLAARLLGPEARGHLAAAQAIGTLIGAIGALGLGEALVYFVSGRRQAAHIILATATLFATLSTTVTLVGAVALMPLMLAGQPDAVTAARCYCLIGLPFVLLGFPTTFLRGLQRFRLWNLLRLIPAVAWLVTLVVVAGAGNRQIVPLILVFLTVQALCIPAAWAVAQRAEPGSVDIDWTLLRPMLRFGTPLFIATIPYTLNLRLDQIILANVESADQLGRYAVSVSWAGLGLPLTAAIGSVLFPRLASMQPSDARIAFAQSTRFGVVVSGAIGSMSAVTAPILIPKLFGQAFAVPTIVPIVLAGAVSVLAINGIVEEGLRGLGEARTVLIGEAGGVVITVVLIGALVSEYGIVGAALASLGGYLAVTLLLVWRVGSRTGLAAADLLAPRRRDLADLAVRARYLVATRKGDR